MKIGFDYDEKAVVTLGLRMLMNTARPNNHQKAINLGLGIPSPQKASSCGFLIGRLKGADDLTIDLTKANIKEIIDALTLVDYFFAFDEDVADIIFGVSKDKVDFYIDEFRHAEHGKKALHEFFVMQL